MEEIKLGKYQHYKEKSYEIICIAKHSESLEDLVIYRALYDDKEFGLNAIWARPKSMFMEKVNFNGQYIPRFKYIE